jgi:membrane protease YdiL (CAAX protease family)
VSVRAFWIRIAAGTALAVSLALALEPPEPTLRIPHTLAMLAGIVVGGALFAAAARCRPSLRGRRRPTPLLVVRHLFLALCATNEELIWRRVLLGELLVAGPVAALALSSAGFALAHRRARLLHVGTGSAFGGVYLATGCLGASIAAHWAYNTLVGGLTERGPP